MGAPSMFGVYTPSGGLVGHFAAAGDASAAALALGEGARVVSEAGAYVVRDGTIRAATRHREPTGRAWGQVPDGYVTEWMAAAYGGCLN